MLNIKNYIRTKVRNLAEQEERLKAREKQSDKLDRKLNKLFDKFVDDEITYEQFTEISTDLMFANIFGTYFFNELDKREDESIEEQEIFDKLSIEDIEALEPISLVNYTKQYINKTGLFENE